MLITRDSKTVSRLNSAVPVGVPIPGKGKFVILAEVYELPHAN